MATQKTGIESYSILDPHILESTRSPFRGLIYLLWLSMIGGILSTICRNYRQQGILIGPNLYYIAKVDILTWLYAEMALIASLFIPFLIQVLFSRGIISIRWSLYVRHIFQATIVFAASSFASYRQWPFVQTSVLVLHSIAMYMKIHSYFAVNEALHRAWELKRSGPEEEWRELDQHLMSDRCIYYEGPCQYPSNVTLSNFLYYLIVPSLVYQLNPPRAAFIRWGVVLEKTFSAAIGLMLLYIIFEHWILPILFELDTMCLAEAILELLFPFTLFYILLFYFVFEVLCTWCSELSKYGIRTFYEDWWNSTTFDQFARKWNKPVHQFLYHHIYEEMIKAYGFKRSYVSAFTFFFSSCLHEFVLAVVSKKIVMYFFVLQMLQIPLISIGRTNFVKQHPLFSNMFLWASLMVGPPLLSLLYCRDYFLTENWQSHFAMYQTM